MVVRISSAVGRWSRTTALALAALGGTAMAVHAEKVLDLTPPPAGLAPLDTGVNLESVDSEVITERYKNRAIKVERHVICDIDGNYVNHGPWIMYDEKGREMGHGNYRHNKPHGKWVRIFVEGEAEMLSSSWGKMFTAPFISTASFSDGQLSGEWKVVDARGREVAVWEYDDGQRHGRAVWYFPDGGKWREASYTNGDLEGEFFEWATDGSLVAKEVYHEGRRNEVRREWYSPGVLKAEAHYRSAKETVHVSDDWWAGIRSSERTGTDGKEIRHGMWTTYYSSGQKAMQGEFRDDKPVGKFAWWHANGMRAIEGDYFDGRQQGRWSWWYPTGKRFVQGTYDLGEQTGQWTRWTPTGDLVDGVAFDGPNTVEAFATDALPADQIQDPPSTGGVVRPVTDRRILTNAQR